MSIRKLKINSRAKKIIRMKNQSKEKLRKILKYRNKKNKKMYVKYFTKYKKKKKTELSKIFRLLDDKKFYKKPSILVSGTAIIQIPRVFCFSKNAYETIDIIKEVAYACKNNLDIIIDHSECQYLDLGASTVMDVLIMEYKAKIKALRMHKCIRGKLSKSQKVNDLLKFSGIVKHLGLNNEMSNELELFPLKKNKSPGTLGADIIEYYKRCLATKGFELTEQGELYFGNILGEVLINCKDHGGENSQWYAMGHYITKEGNISLIIFNFGQTIFEGLNSKETSKETIKDLDNITNKHIKLFNSKWDKETLWTLYALQSGVSRLKSKEDPTRGTGTIKMIDGFQTLGKKIADDGKKLNPIMSITSGNVNIIFDGTYNLKEEHVDGGIRKIIAFNKENDLYKLPDENYVKNIKNYFPGTIITMNFYIDNKYIDLMKKENNDERKYN